MMLYGSRPPNSCGSCTLCCKVLAISEPNLISLAGLSDETQDARAETQ